VTVKNIIVAALIVIISMHILPSRGEESLVGASEVGPGERCVSRSYMKALREKQTHS